MSELAKTARINLLIANYASLTTDGAANMVQAGIGVLYASRVPNIQFEKYSTPSFSVYTSISCDPKYIGEEYSCSLELRDDTGALLDMPDANNGAKMRLSQILTVQAIQVPNLVIPKGVLWPTYQFAWNFPTGIILEPDKAYSWTVTVDGDIVATSYFYIGIPRLDNQSTSPIVIG